jgi:hypothetical protein
MKFCQWRSRNTRVKSIVASFLLMVFVLGCVSVKQERSNDSFMVKGHQHQPKDIDLLASADQNWQRGDIIYVANGHTDHMGLVDDSAYSADSTPDIIDTDQNNVIRRHNDIDKWADQGGWVVAEGYYVSKLDFVSEQRELTSRAFNIGDIYNAQNEIKLVPRVYERNSPSNTHSSQLVRQTYKYLYNIDLDIDGGWWSWPQDIRQNPKVMAKPGASFSRS